MATDCLQPKKRARKAWHNGIRPADHAEDCPFRVGVMTAGTYEPETCNCGAGRSMIRWDEWRGSFDQRPAMLVRTLLAWRGVKLELHKMLRADDEGCFHTHPAHAVRLVLWGGYVEEHWDGGRWSAFFPGRVGWVRPSTCHRIGGLFFGVSYSLWLRFPKCAEIKLRGPGWPADRVSS